MTKTQNTSTAAERIARLSERDRATLRAQVADRIEQLLPLTQLGLPWQASFEKDAARLYARGVQFDHNSALADYNLDAIALAFVLYEAN